MAHSGPLVIGLLVLIFALILTVDALLVTFSQAGIPLSDNEVKGITGVTLVIIAIYILISARKKQIETQLSRQRTRVATTRIENTVNLWRSYTNVTA